MQRSRDVLLQRPPRRRPPAPAPAQPVWWDWGRAVLPAFVRQVLLRPARIGTLALLGGMTAIVLVGAEGWWIVLGISLFQAAASALIVMWVELPARAYQRIDHQGGRWFVSDQLPRPRRPRPGE